MDEIIEAFLVFLTALAAFAVTAAVFVGLSFALCWGLGLEFSARTLVGLLAASALVAVAVRL